MPETRHACGNNSPIANSSIAHVPHGMTHGRTADPAPLDAIDWTGRRVTVMGLGTHGGGVGVTRYLARQGALVTVSDSADYQTLASAIEQIGDLPLVALNVGGHVAADFRTDFIVVNPAVRPDHSCLADAKTHGARLISETELFLARCPANVIGVTGTVGKTTTSTMVHRILCAAGRRTWLGGNVGRSLLSELDRMRPDDWVVLELSSFQLALLTPAARLPRWAIVTNCSRNHLDWHGSLDAYRQAKLRLVRGVGKQGHVVLGSFGEDAAQWQQAASGRAVAAWPRERLPRLKLPGEHNRDNGACAAAVAELVGVTAETIADVLARFSGLPHRIELIADIAGRRFYNDSKSTSPAATMAALSAVEGNVWLIAGGDSKGADFGPLASAIVARSRGAALFGAAGPELHSAIAAHSPDFAQTIASSLDDAVDWCWRQSQPGEAIVLSPACASHDQFVDYRQRGETFRAIVERLRRRALVYDSPHRVAAESVATSRALD